MAEGPTAGRARPEQIIDWAKQVGLVTTPDAILDLPPWHHGIRFCRLASVAG